MCGDKSERSELNYIGSWLLVEVREERLLLLLKMPSLHPFVSIK